MASIKLRHKSRQTCVICGKGDTVSFNRPHSLHKTKRIVKPNLQKKWGILLCQNCFRTLKKKKIEIRPQQEPISPHIP